MPVSVYLFSSLTAGVAASPLARTQSEPAPVILSTDCGTEIDDQWAVIYLALSPEIRLLGFLGNHARNGLTGPKARDTIRDVLENPLGMAHHPPVLAGADGPLPHPEAPLDNEAVRFLLEQSQAFRPTHRLNVLIIGSQTDVASALLLDPSLAHRIRVVMMGFERWPDGKDPWNVMNDPAAARIVFGSGVPLVVGCAEVCRRDLSFTTEECQNLLAGTGAAGAWLTQCFAAFPSRLEHQGRHVWPIWDQIAPAYLLGFTRSVEQHRPTIAADLTFDHSSPAGQLTWIEAVDSERLWPDFVEKLRAWESRRPQEGSFIPPSEPDRTSVPHRAEWMHQGSFGIMVHWLISPPGNTDEEKAEAFNRTVEGFDLEAFIQQFASTGADWLIFTIGQNTGYYCSPNAFLDRVLPGHTSRRDLVLEIAQRVKALGKRFIAYLPSEVYGQSKAVQQAFGWNPADQSIFQQRYQQFIREYAVKFGPLLDGWWFDGCYDWEVFPNRLYDWQNWFAAARAGNPDAIVAFNDGAFCINKVKPVTPLEDYHAGEVHMLQDGKIKLGHDQDSPLYMPDSRFIDGVQWHALLPVDSTFEGGAPYHYSDEVLFQWVQECKAVGGAVTLNLPISLEGRIPEATLAQMQRLGRSLK